MQTKFRLSVRWLCFAVLLAAVVVRLAAQPGLREPREQQVPQALPVLRVPQAPQPVLPTRRSGPTTR